jgi:hypothetical protein
VVQTVAEGVMTFVTVPAPEYARLMDEAESVQVLPTTSLVTSEKSCCKLGEEMTIVEPEASVTEKLLALTAIDWSAAFEPETSNEYPPTEITVSVVSVTSL